VTARSAAWRVANWAVFALFQALDGTARTVDVVLLRYAIRGACLWLVPIIN
jgi:hypothetical protein